jgi:hypothetical protein
MGYKRQANTVEDNITEEYNNPFLCSSITRELWPTSRKISEFICQYSLPLSFYVPSQMLNNKSGHHNISSVHITWELSPPISLLVAVPGSIRLRWLTD